MATVQVHNRVPVLLALLAASLAAAVYLNTLHNPFVFDDRPEVVENQSIRDITNPLTVIRAYPTRPLVNLSYAVDYAMGGLDPFPYHVTNVLLHILNVLLLFLLVRQLVQDADASRTNSNATVAAFAAASLFAVHPMMTEAVGYVSSRSELLSAAMFLACFLCFRRGFVTGRRPWLFAGALLFGLGLGTKETLAMFPFVLLAYDVLIRRRTGQPVRSFPYIYAGLFGIVLVGAIARIWVYLWIEHPDLRGTPLWQNALIELHVIVRYVSLLLYPASQSIVPPVEPIASITDWRAVLSSGVLLLGTAIVVLVRKRNPLVTFGSIWFLLVLLPSAALLLLASFGQPMAEHRVYLASCGFFIIVAAVVAQLLATSELHWPRVAAVGVALTAAVAVLTTATVTRNRVWQNPVRLWEDAFRKAPRAWIAAYGLAQAYSAIGDDAAAVTLYELAIVLRPERTDALVGLARSLMGQARNEYARQVLREVVRRAPGNTAALLASARLEEQAFHNAAEAARLCQAVIVIQPGNAEGLECVRRNTASRQ